MSLRVFERLIGLFRGSEGLFCDIAVLVLLCLPLAAFAAFFALLCAGKFRARSRVWYLVLGDMCLFLFLALYLCGGSLQDAFPVLALILCGKSLYLLLYGALCLVPARPREKRIGAKASRRLSPQKKRRSLRLPRPRRSRKKFAVLPIRRACMWIKTCVWSISFRFWTGSKRCPWARATGWKCRRWMTCCISTMQKRS